MPHRPPGAPVSKHQQHDGAFNSDASIAGNSHADIYRKIDLIQTTKFRSSDVVPHSKHRLTVP